MLQSHQLEELVSVVSGLDREALVDQFRTFEASFPIDFSNEFLQSQTVDRLRHLFLALCIEQQRMPQISAEEAA
jgi:hypothetical protein